MAMILDAFVQVFIEKLAVLAEDKISMILGVQDDLSNLRSVLELLVNVVADAESKKMDKNNRAIRQWVSNLREILYDADDLLDDCRVGADRLANATTGSFFNPSTAVLYMRNIPFKHGIGKRIRAVKADIEKLSSRVNELHLLESIQERPPAVGPRPRAAPLGVEQEIVGIDGDVKILADRLTGGGTYRSKCPICAITGMPGIGKTTLAQRVFKDPQVESHFQNKVFLCVSNEYKAEELLKEIARTIARQDGKENYSVAAEAYPELTEIVVDLIGKRRVLIVLDDLWDEKAWESLKGTMVSAADGSRVLVTTRNTVVAKKMGAVYTYPVKHLPEKEGWQMLCKQVFGEESGEDEIKKLEKTGMQIVKNCGGLPLAIKTIAGILKTRERTIRAWEGVRRHSTWNLENLGEEIKPGLLLSYEDLPPHLKQCFIYCSLFPEDYRFHHQTLVQMWIAQGLVRSEENRELEDIGEDYYNELLMRNLLQAVPEYYDGRGCTMHDLLRALAQHVSQIGTCTLKLRHLFFVKKTDAKLPDIDTKGYLRTLLLSKNPQVKTIPNKYLENLKHLRVLDLSHMGIHKLPASLGDLVHLRFLNVAFTKLKCLPESIGKLQDLQTLKANDLKHLRKLPNAVVQLKNLRHLWVGSTGRQLESMPEGLGNLAELRTLSGFVANDSSHPNMGELSNLQKLTHLSMYKLEKVGSKADAEAGKLVQKRNLNFLRLSCTSETHGRQLEECEMERIEDVFEGLEPPSRLDALHIDGFFGRKLPSYFQGHSLESLSWLRLDGCKSIKQLPPLGHLTNLKALHISSATAVPKIGPEFFSNNGAAKVAFPKLHEFYLKGMTELKEIAALGDGALPCLKKMHIIRCPKLLSLPAGLHELTKLTQLLIEDADTIEKIENLPAVSELKLKCNSKLKKIHDLQSLSFLSIANCRALKEVNCLEKLTDLLLSDNNMVELPDWLSSRISQLSLRRLVLKGTPDLVTRCSIEGEDGPKIKHILHVEAGLHDGSS